MNLLLKLNFLLLTIGTCIDAIDAPAGRAPYQAVLLYNGAPLCGATLIGPQIALTVAHCVPENLIPQSETNKVALQYGSLQLNSGFKLSVNSIVRHPQANVGSSSAPENVDIALLHLASPLTPGANAGAIELANSAPPAGTANVTFTRFDFKNETGTSTGALQMFEQVQIASTSLCGSVFPNHTLCIVDDRVTLLRGGDPLVYNGQLVGVGYFTGNVSKKGSQEKVLVNGFVNIAEVKAWIDTNRKAPSSAKEINLSRGLSLISICLLVVSLSTYRQ